MGDSIVLTCSVRHRFGALWPGRSAGDDLLMLPDLPGMRAELIVEGDVWSAAGARLESKANPFVIHWWFNGWHTVNYALVVYASADSIDLDRFIDIESAHNTHKEYD